MHLHLIDDILSEIFTLHFLFKPLLSNFRHQLHSHLVKELQISANRCVCLSSLRGSAEESLKYSTAGTEETSILSFLQVTDLPPHFFSQQIRPSTSLLLLNPVSYHLWSFFLSDNNIC